MFRKIGVGLEGLDELLGVIVQAAFFGGMVWIMIYAVWDDFRRARLDPEARAAFWKGVGSNPLTSLAVVLGYAIFLFLFARGFLDAFGISFQLPPFCQVVPMCR